MKIPNKLKICGYDYEIIVEDRYKKGVSTSGSHYSYDQKIWIDNKQHQQQQESTLIHEILEAINSLNDLDLSHQQISVLETNLYQVIKQL